MSTMLGRVTPLLLTFNEADNLERTLRPLAWARRIVVIDSGSTDATLDMLRRMPAVEVFQRPFDTFAAQANFGLSKVDTEFTLSLDADYVLTDELVAELGALDPGAADGWYARFRYCIQGRALRSSLLPPRLILYRTALVRYADDGHAHRAAEPPRVARLQGAVLHDDRKPLSRWLASQSRYSAQEARKLKSARWSALSGADRIRTLLLGPVVVPMYCLFVRGLVFDGRAGLFYTWQRTVAETLLALRLLGLTLAGDQRE